MSQKGEAAYLRSPSEYDADSHSGWFESKDHPHSALHELSKGINHALLLKPNQLKYRIDTVQELGSRTQAAWGVWGVWG